MVLAAEGFEADFFNNLAAVCVALLLTKFVSYGIGTSRNQASCVDKVVQFLVSYPLPSAHLWAYMRRSIGRIHSASTYSAGLLLA